MRFSEYLYNAQNKLIKAELPINDLNILAEYVLNKDYQSILIEDPIIDDKIIEFDELLNKVITKSIPIAYLVGFEYFYGRKIIVNENCLIPRTETEELVYNTVEFIYENYPKGSELHIADICTGSGIVGLSIAKEIEDDYQVYLAVSDISAKALEVCKMNMDYYNVNAQILEGDAIEPFLALKTKFDVVVANPPYIPSEEFVDDIVKKHEPHIALFGGLRGSEIHLKIIKSISLITKKQYFIGFELGDGQADIVSAYIKEHTDADHIWKNYDMFSRERNVFCYKFKGR